MRLPLYQVDAFTTRPFGGNPAAVCPLPRWLPDATLQGIALENNLSETAFLVERPAGVGGFELRWFTPGVEVELCGHATLASALVVFERLRPGSDTVAFETRRSGTLTVTRDGELLVMDFPAQPGAPLEPPAGLVAALGGAPREVRRSVHSDLVAYDTEAEVRALRPDEHGLLAHDALGVIATAPGDQADFVSRFFAPRAGVFEDPVTGSAHCVSTPYWAERLGRERLTARQVSARGGELVCTLRGDRVSIAGHALLVLEGTLTLPDELG